MSIITHFIAASIGATLGVLAMAVLVAGRDYDALEEYFASAPEDGREPRDRELP
ncbi:MAG: hypothetical protein IJI68_00610 [Eggerthellaceae bacterium]|nr:hypothetical protein [Eggerthellaceae bacterium]